MGMWLTQLVTNARVFDLLSRRLGSGVSPTHLLLVAAALEIAIDRIAVPLLRPKSGVPPTWHSVFDYAGLFLYYFVGTLVTALLLARCVAVCTTRRGLRDVLAHGAMGVATLLAAVPLVVGVSSIHALLLELAFAAAVLLLVASGVGRNRDLGVQIGLFALAAPLVLHTISAIGTSLFWSNRALDELVGGARRGELALSLVALISPYVFAPRPLVRAMMRPLPVAVGLAIAVVAVIALRTWYPEVARASVWAIGFHIRTDRVDPRLAMYLLALATLVWTLTSCAIAIADSRRQIGLGIALIACGGYAFRWPHHFLLPLLGLALVAEAGRRVRAEELAGLPIKPVTPPIADAAWAAYLSALKSQFESVLGGSGVHSLTIRGEDAAQSSLVIGDVSGIPIRVRIDRIESSVISLDIICGREFDESANADWSLRAVRSRALGVHPEGPPAAPTFSTGEASFDAGFRLRGNAEAFARVFDAELKARAGASFDGWLASWGGLGLRYRVYPGCGAPLDYPLPLSDLALGRPATPERLVAVIALLRDIAARLPMVAPR